MEFLRDLWHQITRVPGPLCSVVCVIVVLSRSGELRLVTEDRQTHDHSIYHASIASRGKNTCTRNFFYDDDDDDDDSDIMR